MEGKQLSFEDCFITRNALRRQYQLAELYPQNGDVIIPPSEIEAEREECRYWVYYNRCCKSGIPPKSYDEWKKANSNKNDLSMERNGEQI